MRLEARCPALPPPMPSDTAKMMSLFSFVNLPDGGSVEEPFMPAEKMSQASSFSGFLLPEMEDAFHWKLVGMVYCMGWKSSMMVASSKSMMQNSPMVSLYVMLRGSGSSWMMP